MSVVKDNSLRSVEAPLARRNLVRISTLPLESGRSGQLPATSAVGLRHLSDPAPRAQASAFGLMSCKRLGAEGLYRIVPAWNSVIGI